jgi:hypothetical protein
MSFNYKSLVRVLCLLIAVWNNKLYADSGNQPFLVLNGIHFQEGGFFASFHAVLGVLDLYETGNYSGLKVNLNSTLYLDSEKGPNWWEYFFKPINLGKKGKFKQILDAPTIVHLAIKGFYLPRKRGFELIQKYIHLRSPIQKEVNQFVCEHFKDCITIGVHHRGTDKKIESPLIPYSETLTALNKLVTEISNKEHNKIKIYVASDEQDFIDYLKGHYPDIIYKDFIRSYKEGPALHMHSFYANNYQKGKEVLLDCLFLSKCNYLICPSTSCIDRAVIKFNPFLELIFLEPSP